MPAFAVSSTLSIRTLFLGTLAAALLCGAPSASAQTADDIVARNIEAKGGLSLIRSVASVKRTSQIKIDGGEARLVTYGKRPDLMRQELSVAGETEVTSFDGRVAWTISPLSGAPKATVVTGLAADRIRRQADFDGPFIDWRTKGLTIEFVGIETLDTRKVYHLRIGDKNQGVVDAYLDVATALEAKLVHDADGGRFEEMLSDYRKVAGIMVPFSVRVQVNGVVRSEMTLKSVEFNVPIADTLFTIPR